MSESIEVSDDEIIKPGDAELESIDSLTEQLGFGKWTVLMVSPYVFWAFVLPYFSIGGAFLNPNVDHWCKEGNITEMTNKYADLQLPSFMNSTNIWEERNDELVRSQCEEYDVSKWLENANRNESYHNGENWNENTFPKKSCSAWEFDTSTFTSTVSMDWNLVCNTAAISPFFQSFYYIGVTIGEPILGYTSDKFGRRWTLKRIWFLFAFASVTSVVSPTYWLLLTMRFLLGIVHASCSVGYVIILETCPSKYRSAIGLGITSFFSLTGIAFGCLGYFIRDWRYLQAACIIPGLLHLFYLPFLDESPRWLINNNRTEEAIAVFKKAARWHNVELQIPANLVEHNRHKFEFEDKNRTSDKGCYGNLIEVMKPLIKELFALVRTPALRRISIAMFGCWFVVGLSYWGMSLAGGTFSSDPFLYIILMSIMEIAGYTWIIPVLLIAGRKTILAFNLFCCAVSMFLILVIPKDLIWVTFCLALVGKLFITASYNILYLYAVELFPTCVRSRGLNMSSMMARIASISAPFVVSSLASRYTWLPSVVFGSAATLGIFLSCLLPESKGNPLLDTVEQVEEFYRKKTKTNKKKSQTRDG